MLGLFLKHWHTTRTLVDRAELDPVTEVQQATLKEDHENTNQQDAPLGHWLEEHHQVSARFPRTNVPTR